MGLIWTWTLQKKKVVRRHERDDYTQDDPTALVAAYRSWCLDDAQTHKLRALTSLQTAACRRQTYRQHNQNTGNCDCRGVLRRRYGGVRNGAQAVRPGRTSGHREATAKELMLPGAMVLLHTPQGDFVFGYGSTELGVTIPPSANTHFRAASNNLIIATPTMSCSVSLPKKLQAGRWPEFFRIVCSGRLA